MKAHILHLSSHRSANNNSKQITIDNLVLVFVTWKESDDEKASYVDKLQEKATWSVEREVEHKNKDILDDPAKK